MTSRLYLNILTCLHCGHQWASRIKRPEMCANRHCHSKNWDRPPQATGVHFAKPAKKKSAA